MLTTDRFNDFFQAVHGFKPFPWQVRLANMALQGDIPEAITVPTSAGKTSVLDAYVYALAAGAPVPRRIVLVVDRRLVVDGAYDRALRIKTAIERGTSGLPTEILHEVRKGLLALGGENPLGAVLLRGGLYREDVWAKHPSQPMIICSTVDQVGSRLLHQGYGVSPFSRSIHAGLLANDALIVLDEAHCSEPFRQTLASINKFRALGDAVPRSPFGIITMTATPIEGTRVLGLTDADRADPVLSKRILAEKKLGFASATRGKDTGLAKAMAAKALEAAHERGTTILVVANRVALARAITTELETTRRSAKNQSIMEPPVLLTGRSRPTERDRILTGISGRIYAGRDRSACLEAPALVIVATQCVEVGADLDVDTLITEACPIDSLKQRLGRLDRLGERGISAAWFVAPAELSEPRLGEAYNDPVYGPSVEATWKALHRIADDGELDCGVDALNTVLAGISKAEFDTMRAPVANAPIIIPVYCDLWAQTSPEPAALPEPAIFLHGIGNAEAEVQAVWRADLPEDRPDAWDAIVAACPPAGGEALRLPLSRLVAWLSGATASAASGSDLEGEESEEEGSNKRDITEGRWFLAWRGADTREPSNDARSIRPGDTIVLPCSAGGCDSFGWAPDNSNPAADLAELARHKARRNAVLRIHPSLSAQLGNALAVLPVSQDEETAAVIDRLAKNAISKAMREGGLPEGIKETVQVLDQAERIEVGPHPSGSGWIISSERDATNHNEETSMEDENSSSGVRFVPLDDHLRHVEKMAEGFAHSLGFPKELAEDLALAAAMHDLGKADPRFQALLWGGDRIQSIRHGPLAKSPRIKNSVDLRKDSFHLSGYPAGGRHELLSLAFARQSKRIKHANDPDLVLHLIASHHGRCRPFAPDIEDTKPRTVRITSNGEPLAASSDGSIDGLPPAHLGSGIAERYWRLTRRYGWWGLSYLEACLRLADHRASAQEEKGELE